MCTLYSAWPHQREACLAVTLYIQRCQDAACMWHNCSADEMAAKLSKACERTMARGLPLPVKS